MIGYKTNIYMEIKNVVSWHEMVVSRHDTVVLWHDTIISCYERVHYITMQTLVIRLQQHNNITTSYSLQIKSQHDNITTQQPPTAVYDEKLLSLLEEEELIWLFSSVIVLPIFLRKPDELAIDAFFRYRIDLHRFY